MSEYSADFSSDVDEVSEPSTTGPPATQARPTAQRQPSSQFSSFKSSSSPQQSAATQPAPASARDAGTDSIPSSLSGLDSVSQSSSVVLAPTAGKAGPVAEREESLDGGSIVSGSIASASTATATKASAAKAPAAGHPTTSATKRDSMSDSVDTAELLASSTSTAVRPNAVTRPAGADAGAPKAEAAVQEGAASDYSVDNDTADGFVKEEDAASDVSYDIQARPSAQPSQASASQRSDTLARPESAAPQSELMTRRSESVAKRSGSVEQKDVPQAAAPQPAHKAAQSSVSDDTEALLRSTSDEQSTVHTPLQPSKVATEPSKVSEEASVSSTTRDKAKGTATWGKSQAASSPPASSAATSRALSRRASSAASVGSFATGPAGGDTGAQIVDAYSQNGDEEGYDSDFEAESRVSRPRSGKNTVAPTDMASTVCSDDEPDVLVIRSNTQTRHTGKNRPTSARPMTQGSSTDRSQRPGSAQGGRQPAPGSWLDDSWDGELVPTIVSASVPAEQIPSPTLIPPRPPVSRPRSALATRQSGGGASIATMTSGSVAGVLAAAPPVYAPAPRSRPTSAGPRRRTVDDTVTDLLRRNPATWDPRDVADWVEYIGMGQYRKRFLHNCIDGRLLLSISDSVLKMELGVGPYGHRNAILQAVAALAEQADENGGSPAMSPSRRRAPRPASARPASAGIRPVDVPRRPASATRPGIIPPDPYLGPALGKVTVYEQRQKLLFELDRAAARAAQHRAIAEQLSHTAQLSAEEVAHLRGLLQDLELKNKALVAGVVGSVDAKGRVPWRPSSPHVLNPHPERIGKPGDDPSIDMTFHPRISKQSQRLLGHSGHGEGGGGGTHRSTFLDRLETDARKRERNKTENDRKVYAPEAVYNDPLLAKRKAKKDYQYVSAYLMAKGWLTEAITLNTKDSECDRLLDNQLQHFQTELNVPVAQVAAISNARGVRKVALVASVLRTVEFMARYDREDAERRSGAKLKELQEKHWEASMGRPKQRKAEEDMAQAVQYFELLGWVGDDAITDDRLSALLKRAIEFKKATEKARDMRAAGTGDGTVTVDWTTYPWASDGLTALQAAAPAASPSAIEAAAVQAGASPGTTVKGPLAPEGSVSAGPMDGAGSDYLGYTVRLLSKCRWDDIERMDNWTDTAKQLGVYRHIRTQKFIEFTEAEIRKKEHALATAYQTMSRPVKVLTKEAADAFYDRLLNDASKRQAAIEKAAQEKLERETKALAATQGLGLRPRSGRR